MSSKSTKLLNIHRNDIGAKYYARKADLDSIFAGRIQEQNLMFFEVHFHIFYRIQTKSAGHKRVSSSRNLVVQG